jgi:hypothetical protein
MYAKPIDKTKDLRIITTSYVEEVSGTESLILFRTETQSQYQIDIIPSEKIIIEDSIVEYLKTL